MGGRDQREDSANEGSGQSWKLQGRGRWFGARGPHPRLTLVRMSKGPGALTGPK